MRINVKMTEDFDQYAETLRKKYFGPTATAKEYRDSYVFAQTIDTFNAPIDVLDEYIHNEKKLNNQRMMTLRQNTYKKLEDISKTKDCSVASAFRAIIMYTVHTEDFENTENTPNVSISELELKITLLEKQLSDCQNTLSQIKRYLKNRY